MVEGGFPQVVNPKNTGEVLYHEVSDDTIII